MAVEGEETFEMHSTLLQMIDADPTMVLDVLQTFDDVEQSKNGSQNVCENKPVPKRAPKESNADSQAIEAPFLFYSRTLNASILSFEQPDGTIRQYRLSTTVFQKNTHYFRCSRLVFICKHFQTMQFVNFELFNTCCIVDATI